MSEQQKDKRYIGLDIGGTKTVVLVGGEDGIIHDRAEFPTQTDRPFESMFRDIVDQLHTTLAESGKVEAIGVSIGGPLDSKKGIIQSPPNLPGWDDVPLKELLEKEFEIPTRIMHDAKACAVAEWWFGAGKGCRDIVFLTFGTGLGCGVICDGKLLESIPGEVGHWGIGPDDGPWIYGRNNAWEGVSSGAGIKQLALTRYPDLFDETSTTAKTVIDAARQGVPEARKILATVSEYLGKGMALLVDLLGSEKIILGSLAARSGDLILPSAINVFLREVHPCLREKCQIVAGTLGERIGDHAALCAAMYRQ